MKRIEDILRDFNKLMEDFNRLDDSELLNKIKNLSKEAEDNALFEVHKALLNLLHDFDTDKANIVIKECIDIIQKYFLREDEFLIITDDETSFGNLIRTLKLEGFKVSVKAYDFDVIEYIYSRRPDVILIDNDLKNHGVITLNILSDEEILKKMPVIVFGGESYEEKIQALSLGAVDYIEKNFDINEVVLKLKNIYRLSNTYIKNNIYDVFTGVYSRYHGDIISKKEFQRVKNAGDTFLFMLLDFDNMAKINLSLGKSKGNDILKESVDIFKKLVANSDIIYRVHGDSFAFMFFNKSLLEVLMLADKMQREIKKLGDKYGENLTFSAGVAEFRKDMEDIDELINLAEKALIRAKQEGGSKILTSKQIAEYNKKRLLIVDDDRIILSILSKRYKNKGYDCLTAQNGEEALKVFNDNKDIDLIISDFYMPGMNGDEFVKEIRKLNKNVKIIVLSGHKSESHVQRALNAGADEYVTKPFSPVELDIRIKKLIG
ncbi:MAG: response regulator [Caloramator sp.]|nr:response regulator [Caloramator sp.]